MTVLVGLHITKCAGTTLANAVTDALSPHKHYICSAPVDAAILSWQELPCRLDWKQVDFVFGHYVHESLFSVFRDRDMVWFTGVRDPVEKAVSEYHQMCKVAIAAGRTPLTAEAFLSMRTNVMCAEFLRAFPTIDAQAKGSLAEKALEAARLFDLIYSLAGFEQSARRLLELIGLSGEKMIPDNLRWSAPDHGDFLTEQAEAIRVDAPKHFDQDIALYQALSPALDEWRPFSNGTDVSANRERWLPAMMANNADIDSFSRHLAPFYAYDFVQNGRREELREMLHRQARWIDAVLSAEARM
ncbi:MAG: hypothetical protein K2P58_13495 [Hyphomonadaceae bacterium]|nr:hypothetical protein [Hyphomonadaceae bacterium]